MDIADWRKRIDEVDRQLVSLLNQRATAAWAIGRLKSGPIYDPEREKAVIENVRGANGGPLPDRELAQIYERIIDVMRKFEYDSTLGVPKAAAAGGSEIEAENNE
jgi:chorismate mutase